MRKINLLAFVLLTAFFQWSCTKSEFSAQSCKPGVNCTPTVQAQSFSWHIGQWEDNCSRACGGGIKTREVRCKNSRNQEVPESECVGDKPTTEKSCNEQACPPAETYSWNVGAWNPSCSSMCGGGTARTVKCQSNNSGAVMPDRYCSATKPATTQVCPNNCSPVETYEWSVGQWDKACACGVSEINRSVKCIGKNSQQVVSDSKCNPNNKPAEKNYCPSNLCTYSYEWVKGQWNNCSKSCGGGIQTRSLGCVRNDGIYVAHTLCTAPRPITQKTCGTTPCTPVCAPKTFTKQIPAHQRQLDILLIVDDSGSMYEDSSRLAQKLEGFTSRFNSSKIDWQMCVTSTDVGYYKGRPIQWKGTNAGHILKKSSGNMRTIFVETMRWIGAGFSTDEQGIKAMNLAIKDNGRSKCFRRNAALAVVVISDEDERSVGGLSYLNPAQYKALDYLNKPQSFIDTVRANFPAGKKVIVNSIVVTNKTCQAKQDAQGADSKSYIGRQYIKLSGMTNGRVQSICERNYAVCLDHFYENIHSQLGSYTLACRPSKGLKVKLDGNNYSSFRLSGSKVIFEPILTGPAQVTGSYCCQGR